jgi:hypothetical protein
VIDSQDPDEIERILDGLVDPAGQFYRFSLAGSLLRAAKPAWKGNGTRGNGGTEGTRVPSAPAVPVKGR